MIIMIRDLINFSLISIRLFKVKHLLYLKPTKMIFIRNINNSLLLYVIYKINGYPIRNASSMLRLISSYILILK